MNAQVTDDMQPRDPSDIITDEATLARTTAPGTADWYCNNCDKSNVFGNTHCDLCRAPKNATPEDIMNLATAVGVGEMLREDGLERSVVVQEHGPEEGREILTGRGSSKTSGLEDALSALRGEPKEPPEPETTNDEPTPTNPTLPQESLFERIFPNGIDMRVVFGVLAAIVVGWFLIWGLSTREVEGQISELTWEHNERVERFSPVRKSDWQTNITSAPPIMPTNGSGERAGASIISCEERFHHHERYQCGTRQVEKSRQVQDGEDCKTVPERKSRKVRDGEECHTIQEHHSEKVRDGKTCHTTPRKCRPNNNGSVTCTGGDRICEPKYRTVHTSRPKKVCKPRYRTEYYTEDKQVCEPRYRTEYYTVDEPEYCERPIHKTYCDYDTYVWKLVESRTLNGTGHNTRWPDLAVGVHDRRHRSATYQVSLTWKDRGKLHTDTKTVSKTEYDTWNPGDVVILSVRNFGGVASMRRK